MREQLLRDPADRADRNDGARPAHEGGGAQAHDLATRIDQRAARVAGPQAPVKRHEPLDLTALPRAPGRAPGRHQAVIEAHVTFRKPREGQSEVADPERARVPPLRRLDGRFRYPKNRKVGAGIATDERSVDPAAAGEQHAYALL